MRLVNRLFRRLTKQIEHERVMRELERKARRTDVIERRLRRLELQATALRLRRR